MGRVDGRVAIVTGSARGVGEATARLLAAEGARVVLGDVLDEQGNAVAKSLGGQAIFRHLDITNESQWSDIIDAATSIGPIEILVNNAAVLHIGPIEETTTAVFRNVLEVNTLGTFLGIRSVIPAMRAAGGGSIVNISSISGWHPAAGIGAYAASKFGVRGLTKVAALELGQYGIRVNCINAAVGNPEMLRPFLPPEALGNREATRTAPPVGRVGCLDDVARAVLFLASDESGFFSGADFPLDGGSTAGIQTPTRSIPGASARS